MTDRVLWLSLDGISVGMQVLEKDTARVGMVMEIRGELFIITLANGRQLICKRTHIESLTDYTIRTFGWWRAKV